MFYFCFTYALLQVGTCLRNALLMLCVCFTYALLPVGEIEPFGNLSAQRVADAFTYALLVLYSGFATCRRDASDRCRFTYALLVLYYLQALLMLYYLQALLMLYSRFTTCRLYLGFT
jgi:hypothetical protein